MVVIRVWTVVLLRVSIQDRARFEREQAAYEAAQADDDDDDEDDEDLDMSDHDSDEVWHCLAFVQLVSHRIRVSGVDVGKRRGSSHAKLIYACVVYGVYQSVQEEEKEEKKPKKAPAKRKKAGGCATCRCRTDARRHIYLRRNIYHLERTIVGRGIYQMGRCEMRITQKVPFSKLLHPDSANGSRQLLPPSTRGLPCICVECTVIRTAKVNNSSEDHTLGLWFLQLRYHLRLGIGLFFKVHIAQ